MTSEPLNRKAIDDQEEIFAATFRAGDPLFAQKSDLQQGPDISARQGQLQPANGPPWLSGFPG